MKKNTLMNKKVIKALTIGLSASIMFQPIGALADENITDPVLDDGVLDEANEKMPAASIENEALEQVETVEDADKEAADKIEAAVDAVEIVADKKILEDVADLQKAADELEEAAGTLDEEHTEIVDDEEVTVVGTTTEAVSEVKDSVEILASEGSTIEGALTAAEKAADEADKVIDEVAKTEEKAVKDMDAIIAKIKQDGTISATNESYVQAEEIVKAADAAYEQAKTDYEAAKSDYDTAVKAVADAQKEYDEALANGTENLETAKKELEALKEKSAALKTEAEKALDAFNKTEDGKLLALDAKANDAKVADWNGTLDPLFDSVMKEYYVNKFVDEKATDIKTKVVKFGEHDEYNYFEVTYTVGEESFTKYYNYRLADKNANGGMVIFEKTESFFVGDTDEKFVLDEEKKASLAEGEIVVINDDDDFVIENEEGEYVVAENKAADSEYELAQNESLENENTTYSFDDESGELTKTTTADVVTTIFERKSETYETEAEAQEALAAVNQDENKSEGSIETITDTVSTATATYYVTFTKTITVDKKFTNPKEIDETREQNAYLNSVVEGIKEDVENEDYLVSVDSAKLDTTVVRENMPGNNGNDKPVGNANKVSYTNTTATVEYTYIDTTTATEDFSWLDSVFGGKESYDNETARVDRELAEKNQMRVGDFTLFDGEIMHFTYEYTVTYTKTAEGKDDAAAQAALDALIAEDVAAKSSAEMGTASAKIVSSKFGTKDYVSYEVCYLEKDTSVEENVVISTTTWSKDELLDTTVHYTNDKLDEGDVFLTNGSKGYSFTGDDKKTTVEVSDEQLEKIQRETKEFRDFLNGIKADKDSIDDLVSAADDADKAVEAAQDEVDTLSDKLNDLKANGSAEAIKDMQAKLELALENLKAAEDNKNLVDSKLRDAAEARDNRIDELTPNPEPEVVPSPEPAPQETPAPTVNNGRTPAPARAVAPTEDVEIEDEEPALAETPEVVTEETTEVVAEEPVAEIEEVPVAEEATVIEEAVIEEEETPLANLPEQQQMSWWWLLIVLVLGTTGAEMYRRHMVKKNALKVESEKKDK